MVFTTKYTEAGTVTCVPSFLTLTFSHHLSPKTLELKFPEQTICNEGESKRQLKPNITTESSADRFADGAL